MVNELKTEPREIVQVEDARIRPMMGINVLESLPLAQIPYEIVDPFILVHEGVVPISPEMPGLDTSADLITHRLPLEQVLDAIGIVERGEGIKVTIEP